MVAHAQKSYTSFEYRVYNLGEREADVLKLIRQRMREVLESWLPHDTLSSKFWFLCKTFQLDEELEEEKDVPSTTLTDLHGAESIGNTSSYEFRTFT